MISVIMSVYNEPHAYLRASIESILKQTYGDFEFLIVFDAPSNEANGALLKEYAEKDGRIRVIRNEKNIGLTASLNKAIPLAQGEYIARMDADDISAPDRFLHQKEFLEANNLDITGGFAQTIDENNTVICKQVAVPVEDRRIKRTLRLNSCIFHPSWFARRRVFEVLRAYDGEYAEDYDFLLRAAQQNFVMGNLPEVVLQYRMNTHSISRQNLYKQFLTAQWLQKKYFSRQSTSVSAEQYVASKFSEKKAAAYCKSEVHLNTAIAALNNKNLVKAAFHIFCIFCTSSSYTQKLFRYIVQYIR